MHPALALPFWSPRCSSPSASSPIPIRRSCWMPYLSRLFAATSQTSRLLRSCPRTTARVPLTSGFRPLAAPRAFRSSMSTFANGAPLNAKPLEAHGNFDLIKKFKLDFADIHVSKWKSRSSGLSVVHLDYDGAAHHTDMLRQTYSLICSTPRQRIFRRRYRECVHAAVALTMSCSHSSAIQSSMILDARTH